MATKTKSIKREGYIYALSENGVIRYVGQAKDPKRRYSQHCSLAQNMGKLPRHQWLQELIKGGSTPSISTLEKTDDMDAAEIRWIKKLRDEGLELVNVSDGGQTMEHLYRAKQVMPWGRGHSPTQRILMMLKSDIRTMERFGKHEEAEHIRKQYERCVENIDRVGKDVMNYLLWEREQEKNNAR